MISWTKLLTLSLPKERNFSIKKYPQVVIWNVTSCCNLNCCHCYFFAKPTKDIHELSQREAKDFIEDLAKFKVPRLIFSGGEPLLRKDIFELGKFAKDKGIDIALSTNGTLITKNIAKKIKQAGFFYVGISLDGMEKTNDTFRKTKGAFRFSLAGIKNCQRAGLKVGLRFTLTKYNFRDLLHIFDLAERESLNRICIYHLVYAGRGLNLKEDDLNPKQKRQALELIWQKTLDFQQRGLNIEVLTVDNHADGIWIYLKFKKNNPQFSQRVLKLLKVRGGNSSGVNLAALDNCGNIYPDQFWRSYLLGNIRKKKFSLVWQDKDNRLLQHLRNRKSLLKGRCQRCNFLAICNGNFRARADAVFADPWAEDPACYLTEEEIKEIWN